MGPHLRCSILQEGCEPEAGVPAGEAAGPGAAAGLPSCHGAVMR